MAWEWVKAVPHDVAKFATDEALQLFKLEKSSFDLKRQDQFECLIQAIYETLATQKIQYDLELESTSALTQRIRTPIEILKQPKQGTCLDLALLFCGLCLGYGLLPKLIILESHVLVIVSLELTRDQWDSNDKAQKAFLGKRTTDSNGNSKIEPGPFQGDVEFLKDLVDDGRQYIAVECTGFAWSKTINREKESAGLQRNAEGYFSFEDAKRAGRQQLDRLPFKYAIDIEVAHKGWGIEPEKLAIKGADGSSRKTTHQEWIGNHNTVTGSVENKIAGDKVEGDKVTTVHVYASSPNSDFLQELGIKAPQKNHLIEELSELSDILNQSNLKTALIELAFITSLPPHWVQPIPELITEKIESLASVGDEGVDSILGFVDRLAYHDLVPEKIKLDLQQWFKKVIDKYNLLKPKPWNPEVTACLFIKVRPAKTDQTNFNLEAWLVVNDSGDISNKYLYPLEELIAVKKEILKQDCPLPDSLRSKLQNISKGQERINSIGFNTKELKAMLVLLLHESFSLVDFLTRGLQFSTLSVEIFLPVTHLTDAIDMWDFWDLGEAEADDNDDWPSWELDDDEETLSERIGSRCHLVVRSLERAEWLLMRQSNPQKYKRKKHYKKIINQWLRNWNLVYQLLSDDQIEKLVNPEDFTELSLGKHSPFSNLEERLGAKLGCLPDEQDERVALFQKIISEGTSIMIWSRHKSTNSNDLDEIDLILKESSLKDLSSSVFHKRKQAIESKDKDHLGHHLALFFDDPSRLPSGKMIMYSEN